MKHYSIGGSSINRVISCPASVKRIESVNTQAKSNTAADLGNLLHDAMEVHYKHNQTFEEMLGVIKFAGMTLNDDHLPALYALRNHTETVLDNYDIDVMLLEPFVELIPGVAGGSIDMLGISADGKTAMILDYKTGVAPVRAKDNKQVLFYTLCCLTDPTTAPLFKNVVNFIGAIIQPRVHNTADIWEFDLTTLMQAKKQVLDAVEATKTATKGVAGSHCHWCAYAPYCPEKRARAESALLLEPKHQKSLNQALPLALELKAWAQQVIDAATDYASKGVTIKDHKLVNGRGMRKWSDEVAAGKLLSDQLGIEAFTSKLLSPTQATKLIFKNNLDICLDNLIVKSQGKQTLVNLDDPREEITFENSNDILIKALDNNLVKK